MRLDGRKGDRGWYAWHCERCVQLQRTQWIDDETNEWAEVVYPYVIIDRSYVLTTLHKAKRIIIIPSRRLVLVNPHDDDVESECESNGLYAWRMVEA